MLFPNLARYSATKPHSLARGLGHYPLLLEKHAPEWFRYSALLVAPSWAPRADATTPESRAVRIGALIADLEILADARNQAAGPAYWKHDTAAIAHGRQHAALVAAFASEIAASLEDVPHEVTGPAILRSIQREGLAVATISITDIESAAQATLASRPHLVVLGNCAVTASSFNATRISPRRKRYCTSRMYRRAHFRR